MIRESTIQKNIRAALNRTMRVRLVRNTCGVDTTRGVRYGLGVGSADLVGVLRGGRCFALEIKRPGERLRPEQQAWWRAFYAWGGRGGMATSVDEALRLLALAEGTP